MALGSFDTSICNLALTHLGVGTEIQDAATEASAEAMACRRVYDTCRQEILRDFPWPFAQVTASLDLVEEDPDGEWGYSYAYPSQCLMIRRVLPAQDSSNSETLFVSAGQLEMSTNGLKEYSRIPFTVENDGSASDNKLILTDQIDARIKYTKDVTQSANFPPDFRMAFSLLLASVIAPRVTGGDPYKLGERALKLYSLQIAKAGNNSANESQMEPMINAEMIRERG